MNKPQTWHISPEQYAAMTEKVKAAGIPVSGNAGTAQKNGATVEWAYDGSSLSITVLSTPPFCTGMVERAIAKAVNEAL